MSSEDKKTSPQPSRDDVVRNFRSHYYEKVGFHGVDERKTLETLLTDNPINVDKCAKFAIKFSVPSNQRMLLWRVILGIDALYPNNRDYVWKWRKKPYSDLKAVLILMKKIGDFRPKAQNLTVVYLLMKGVLHFDIEEQLHDRSALTFMAIAEDVSKIGNDEIEIFWISKQLTDLMLSQPDEIWRDMRKMYLKLLSSDAMCPKLFGHLEKIGLNEDIPLDSWFRRAFAGILDETSLEKIWDKLIGGSVVILVYVALSLIQTSKTSLLGCQTSKEAIRCLISTSEDADDRIAQRAIELWTNDGCLLLPSGYHDRHLSSTSSNTSNSAKETSMQPSINSNTLQVKIQETMQLAPEIRLRES